MKSLLNGLKVILKKNVEILYYCTKLKIISYRFFKYLKLNKILFSQIDLIALTNKFKRLGISKKLINCIFNVFILQKI